MTAVTASSRRERAALRHGCGAACWLACGAARGRARRHGSRHEPGVPQPLIEKIPVVIGVHLPLEFRDKVYEEKREGGRIQHRPRQGAVRRLHAAPGRHVRARRAGDVAGRCGTAPIRRSVASSSRCSRTSPSSRRRIPARRRYAASLRTVDPLYSPRASWSTAGRSPGMDRSQAAASPGRADALQAATRLAMRDAAAKLAAEFREQAIARGLLPATPARRPR